MSTISRINCPVCNAECIAQEVTCWQCGMPLRQAAMGTELERSRENMSDRPATKVQGTVVGTLLSKVLARPAPAPAPAAPEKPLINFEPGASSSDREEMRQAEQTAPQDADSMPTNKRTAMTLTGEMVEIEDTPAPILSLSSSSPLSGSVDPAPAPPAAVVGNAIVEDTPTEQMLRLTFCKNCGFQNEEGIVECVKCKMMLEVVPLSSVREIEPLPRAWGFDVLGAVWIVLGLAAVYCGQFLIKATSGKGTSWADYFWTGIVVCAPGVLIFMRHYFCKLLFWVMTLGSILVWSVIGFLWIRGLLLVTDNGQIGLTWLAALSTLSAVSYFTVRQNDAFDYGA